MIVSLSRKITRSLIRNSVIEFDDFAVYQYGIEVFLLTLSGIVGLLAIGILTNRFVEAVLFMLSFCTLRMYAGGYHAKTASQCFLFFVSLWWISVVITEKVVTFNPMSMVLIITAIASVLIYMFSPVSVVTRPITEDERIVFRKYSLLITAVYCVAITTSIFFSVNISYVGVFSMGMLMEALMLLVEYYKKEIDYEKHDFKNCS